MLERIALAGLLLAAAGPAQKVDFPALLESMTDLDRLWAPPAPGTRNIQFSSYDRASDRGIGDQDAWYANRDTSNFLRTETRDGKQEHVLADAAGPGAVVRIWSADPKGMLFCYIDGAEQPTWAVDFKELTAGKHPALPEPLAGERSKGHNCHVPFGFQEHIKITSSSNRFYYHVNVLLYPQGTAVESFHPGLLEKHAAALAETAGKLSDPHATLPRGERRRWQARLDFAPAPEGEPHKEFEALSAKGPLVLRGVRLQMKPGEQRLADTLRALLLLVEVDGHAVIRVPVGDFFGSAPEFMPYQSFPMGVAEGPAAAGDLERWGYCYFPMPARSDLRVALRAAGPVTGAEAVLDLFVDARPLPEGTLAFHASWHHEKQVRTRPFKDHRVLDARGPGRFVGCSVVVGNPTRAWWGEGDEKFFVDGERSPSTFGTGTEDYFGYAWCWPGLFASAYHAQVQCDGPGNFGWTCVGRFQVHDMVPFQKSFLFDMELWHWKDVFMDYSSTAYWYGRPDASSGTPDPPPFEMRKAETIEPPPPFVAAGAIEGESLEVLGMTGGTHEAQDVSGFGERQWSRDHQLWWQGGKPGDRLTLALPVPAPGRYRLRAVFTKAPDYGIVQVHLAGAKLGGPIDLYGRRVAPAQAITLGEVELEAGAAPLALEIVGKHESAVPKYMAGLDYLLLEGPIPETENKEARR